MVRASAEARISPSVPAPSSCSLAGTMRKVQWTAARTLDHCQPCCVLSPCMLSSFQFPDSSAFVHTSPSLTQPNQVSAQNYT